MVRYENPKAFIDSMVTPMEFKTLILAAAVAFPEETQQVMLSLGFILPKDSTQLSAFATVCGIQVQDPGVDATPNQVFNNWLDGLVTKWSQTTDVNLGLLILGRLPKDLKVNGVDRQMAIETILSLRNQWESRTLAAIAAQ